MDRFHGSQAFNRAIIQCRIGRNQAGSDKGIFGQPHSRGSAP